MNPFPGLLLIASIVASNVLVHAARPPNIVLILTDDQGWGDLGFNGNENLATPNIDSLARDGAVFDRFYVCPVCAPTRAEVLTGRYHPRSGVTGVSRGRERMALNEVTIADVLKEAGYATGAFGKWHNGTQYPYHPNGRGFDEFYGFCSGHWGDYFDPPLEHNGTPVVGNGYIVDDLTERALEFIEQNREKPFFCYIPYNVPHTPMQVPDKFFQRFRNREITMRAEDPELEDVDFTRVALAMCENVDWNVGRVLEKLDKLGLEEDTVVIYFSDNGPNSWRWNGGMRGRKGSTDEGGVRSPFAIRWPGKIAGGTKVAKIAGAIDLFPTLLDIAGAQSIDSPAGPVDGVDLAPLLDGSREPWPERILFTHWNGRISARTQTHRLDHEGRLYDMVKDPSQRHDIAARNPELAGALAAAVAEWRGQVFSTEEEDPEPPFPVGFSEFPITQLPARDAIATGGIERSSRYPNCSFFRNWRATDDTISWNVAVATPGRYEAAILYTCPTNDIGSTIELELNGSRLTGTVSESHDPPLRGMENDRVPRPGESYVKDFELWRVGEFDLEAGSGRLTIRATNIPGSEVMQLRGLYLTLLK